MEDQNVATRLKVFMENEGLTISQFADRCGIPRPSLSQLLSGRNKKLSDVVVKQIHDQFPDLSVLWLMFGEGEMQMPKPINPTLASEAAKFMDDESDVNVNSNLSELTSTDKERNISDNQANKRNFANENVKMQIDKISANPRKVVSITIFYDDNSYETFIPEKK
ncbi:MAG: helix-turn-helix transcriptional regulator [Ruminococcus sp.]|nr:helix-turn-helix transcriptional regulator [Ruminococcus sp.]MCM1291942.1 helix-turn-helix transcriptional regulator [Bacteroides sp.]